MARASSPLCLGLYAAALLVLTTSTSAAATPASHPPPQHILQSTTKSRIPGDACTFRASEVQACNTTTEDDPRFTTYLKIDTVFAADGSVAVDVASTRPRHSVNSYQRLGRGGIYEVATLEDGKVLSVKLKEDERLRFAYGERQWGLVDRVVEEGRAWCEVGGWTDGGEDWTCIGGNAESNRVSLRIVAHSNADR
jgi:hypothetical protein